MALKEDIESIKNDLIGESRFLEQYIHIENYFKKHKKKVILIIAAAVALLVGNYVLGMMEANKKLAANDAYLAYVKNPQDAAQLESIKANNPALFTLIELKKAVDTQDTTALEKLAKSEIDIVAKLAAYHLATLSGDPKKMADYTLEEKAFLKDFTSLQLAFKLYEAGRYKEAQDALKKIPFESQLKKSANHLEHYGLNQ